MSVIIEGYVVRRKNGSILYGSRKLPVFSKSIEWLTDCGYYSPEAGDVLVPVRLIEIPPAEVQEQAESGQS